MKIETTAILGAGSWGTALAALWGKQREILLWGNNPARVEELRKTRENREYLPGFKLPDSVRVTNEMTDCAACGLVVFVIPSTAFRAIAERFSRVNGNKNSVLLSCTKGIEHGSGKRMSQILEELLPNRVVAVLSGPNLALEVARELPTATVIGCKDSECAAELQACLGRVRFRI